ncbi:YkgJ family cysteine cluster protein [Pelomonas sp. Root1237]|uniref:YkgJ family cysteine cluster protein n=1 Tax=Pelomonas sp. Root1237 TaxID=1736434 RepID=UPI0009EC02E2|nr:YkgJ family cysteine cluster protein [Pelomonas sp. Root1237]
MTIPISADTPAEAELSRRIQRTEAEEVVARLAGAVTERQLIAVAENAAGFAKEATARHLHPESPPVACKAGCSWCCYQLVPVSVPETLQIAAFLQDLPTAEADGIKVRLRMLDRATRGITPKQRVGVPKPCAFLQDGRCAIYAVRPLACAEFTSYDLRVCKKGQRKGFKPDSVIHEKARMLVYYAVQRGLTEGLKTAAPLADCSALELTAALVVALDSPDGAALWANGQEVFRQARLHLDKGN